MQCGDQRGGRAARGLLIVLLWLLPGSAAAATDLETAAAREAHALWKQAAGLHIEGDYKRAVELYREALALHPTARIHNYLAWSLSELGRYEEAAQESRAAIALDPGYPNAYNDLGAYLIEQGRAEEAEPWLRKAIQMEGYCCTHFAYYQLGRALLLQSRVEEARAALRTALIVHPRYRPAARLLAYLRGKGMQQM